MRKLFLAYFSRVKGPPRLRFHVCGRKFKYFYKLVACNQRDRKNGKHMEVLGSFAPRTHTGIKELRLRFSRCKFWLGVGADMTRSVAVTLARAGIIPPPPPPYGRRARGWYDELASRREEIRKAKLIEAADFLATGQRVEYELENVNFADGEVERQTKLHKILR